MGGSARSTAARGRAILNPTSKPMRLTPQTGTAFELAAGDILRVIDPEGEQVADLVAFTRDPAPAWLSSGRTFDYNDPLYLTTGHVLYSPRSRAMLTITADTVGRHDFLYTPCSP